MFKNGITRIVSASTSTSRVQQLSIRTAHNLAVRTPAQPHTPAAVPSEQAPNRLTTWSENQAKRPDAMTGPRFEQTAQLFQPTPLAAISLIAEQEVRLVKGNIAACDGEGGALGHPRIYINLDKPGPKACNYCGSRFEQDPAHHHHH
ncbi:ubiquinone oxidoreductase 20 kd subunit [Meredithblackwellia eburnea MCA 4105]